MAGNENSVHQTADKPLVKPFKGLAVIINHEHFDIRPEITLSRRNGSIVDVKNLKKTLLCFGFTVEDYIDKNACCVKNIIEYYSTNRDMSEFDCLLVVVMSHGNEGGKIYAKDNEYFIYDIWEPFLQTEALKNKPKIFLFQACRGEFDEQLNKKKETKNNEVAEQQPIAKLPKLPKLPHYPDFLFGFSTQEFHKSHRSSTNGSLYIQAVCEVLKNISGQIDIFTLLTNVTRITTCKGQEPLYQTPVYSSFLRKKLILNRARIVAKESDNSEIKPQDEAFQIYQHNSDSAKDQTLTNGIIVETLESDVFQRQTKYNLPNLGHAIIFHTDLHTQEMNNLSETLNSFQYTTKKYILTENFKKEIEDESKTLPIETGCLLVFLLAPLSVKKSEAYHHEPCFEIDGTEYETTLIWEHFLPDKCEQLLGQPKIFFFVDPENWVKPDSVLEKPALVEEPSTVTSSADFLFVYGFGKTYLDQLITNIANGGNIVHSITDVADFTLDETFGNQTIIPHFHSTLRFALNFKPPIPAQEETSVAIPGTSSSSNNGTLQVQEPYNNQIRNSNLGSRISGFSTSGINTMSNKMRAQLEKLCDYPIVDIEKLNPKKKLYRIKNLKWVELNIGNEEPEKRLKASIEIGSDNKDVFLPPYFTENDYSENECKSLTEKPHFLNVTTVKEYHNLSKQWYPNIEIVDKKTKKEAKKAMRKKKFNRKTRYVLNCLVVIGIMQILIIIVIYKI